MNKLLWFLLIACFPGSNVLAQKTVRYELHIKDSLVNFTGVFKRAIAVNGQIPMPELHFTQGDTAEIHVYNDMDEATSLHWHGLFLPNREDGVPYLTQMPIPPHSKHVYRFPVIQHGTHWYHSHSGMQEQIGMYGSMILHKRDNDTTFRKGIDDLPTIPLILSEWTNLNPNNVHRMLHNASDWFAIKKGTTQSYAEAIRAGHLKTKLTNEWKRMLAMDVSDVYYDRFLINGKSESNPGNFKAGDKVRLRISNGGASTYFWLNYAGGKITVVANDGNDVEPVEVDRLIIAVSETYDIVVTIPDNNAYQLLATSEDRTGSAAVYLGNGPRKTASPLPRLNYFEGMKMMNDMMQMNGELNDMGMQMSLNTMDMNAVMYDEINDTPELVTLNYNMLRSTHSTRLRVNTPVKELKFELTGNMNRYVWSLNNKVVSESDKILIKKGETVRIILHNASMMRHPMHLHGHDFRVLNDHGDYAPLKNVIDIMPMETDTLEFRANAEGDWFFHCHILYHMMSGMGRVFTYENQAANPLIPDPRLAQRKLFSDDRKLRVMARNDFASNGNDGMLMVHNTRWSLGTEWRLGYNDMHGYETETHLGRYLGKMQWIMPFIGFDWRYRSMEHNEEKNLFGQRSSKNNRAQLSAGIQYTLPMLFQFKTEVYANGNLRLQLMREDIPVSKRLRMSMMVNSDKEYMGGLRYIAGKNIGISAHYDSDMGFGAGLTVSY
ncbi:MAG: multicopper oxidase domain-containing protein [Sphingobacteriia bacterium]|nr:multicopper oxidase domain-containing protein [Sphingobacteriia bacterium]